MQCNLGFCSLTKYCTGYIFLQLESKYFESFYTLREKLYSRLFNFLLLLLLVGVFVLFSTRKCISANASSSVTQKESNQDQTYFTGHTGKCFRQSSVNCEIFVCDHDITSTLEINSNGDSSENVESCSSTIRSIISPLPQCLWPPNLAVWWITMRSSHPWSHMTLWSRGRSRLREKLKTFLH